MEKKTTNSKAWRDQATYKRSQRRALSVRVEDYPTNPFLRALFYFTPWKVQHYPGKIRGVLTILQHKVTYSAVQHWKFKTRKPPRWACIIVRDYLATRRDEISSLISWLDDWIANPESRDRRKEAFSWLSAGKKNDGTIKDLKYPGMPSLED